VTTALVESLENEMDSGVFEMTLPVRSVVRLHGEVAPERRPAGLVARWVRDPRGESGLICSWVPRTGTGASVSFDA
jgi:hypothetical protein